MASLAVCRLGSSLRMGVGLVVVCFIVSAPLLLHFMPSRHVATCRTPPGEGGGSKAQGGGGLPTLGAEAQAGAERAKRSGGLHKRSAEDWGYPLRSAIG